MAAFPLPTGHPFTSVRPGYAGFESTPAGSVINATASYVGASGDYPANAVTLQVFATQGGTWTIGTPTGLTLQTSPAVNQAYTTAVYTGGIKGNTYTFTSISLTPAQGSTLGWTGLAPSVTLTIPSNVTSIASGYYVGGNAIYLTPILDSTLTPIVQGITDYFFVCTTSAAYTSVDSIGTAVIPFPTGVLFSPGTTTTLNFTVQCRSNGILGQSSIPFTIGIIQPAVPSLTGVLSGNNVNLTFADTTPGCTFNLSYSGAIIASGITSPYSYVTTAPGNYTFQVQAALNGLTTFSVPSTTAIYPTQPAGIVSTISGLSISLAWTSPVGTGYTYNVSRIGVVNQSISIPNVQYTGLPVGSMTFYIQSVYGGLPSTTCNVQLSINTTPPYDFRTLAFGSSITLSWANDTPGATFTLSSSSPSTLPTQNGLTTSNYTYTTVPGGSYSFTVFSTSASIQSTPTRITEAVSLSAPTNFGITTLSDTATLNWQASTAAASFNISYTVGTTLSSKPIASGITSTTISNLPAANYIFGIQSILSGVSSSFATANAIIVAAPTSFKATSIGTTISLSWNESTAGCSFTVTNPSLGTKTTTNSNVQYIGATPGSSYLFTLTPCNTTSFVGNSVTTTGIVLSTPSPTAVLSGINVNVGWPAVTGTSITYTVSSSPGVPTPPTQPGSALSVSFVSPPPGNYTFRVTAFDSFDNVSSPGASGSLTVPVPQPTSVTATMTASSQLTVTWTETLPGCTFTFTGAPSTTANSITNVGTSYTGIFNNLPPTTPYTVAVVAASGGISSIASSGVTVYTFSTFNVTLSAACSQSGTTNNVYASYTMTSPAGIYAGVANNGPSPYTANVAYSGLTLTPPITTATAGLAGTFVAGYYGMYTGITNTVPTTFPINFVVSPDVTGAAVQANGTTLYVRWSDSTTAGCSYSVSGSAGGFLSNNIPANSGGTGIYFYNAVIGTPYSFTVTASLTGTYTASRYYQQDSRSVVTTETIAIPYTITSPSAPSTSVTPIAYPATFTARATGTTIAINWGAVTGATGYNILNGESILFSTTTATTCNYTGTVGTTYVLTVRAIGPSVSNTNPTTITVIPVAAPVISSITQYGSTITVTATGTNLSISTPAGLSAPTGTSTFTFTNVKENFSYPFNVTASNTNATAQTTSNFITLATSVIGSTFATGTSTITTNWTYTGVITSVSFDVYANDILVSTVGSNIRTATFNQTAGVTSYAVYVASKDSTRNSIASSTSNVQNLTVAPTIASSSVNGLGFTVQWTYPTNAKALSNFQVWNSGETATFGSPISYVANQLNYNSLFNVPSIAAYSFVVVATDLSGGRIASTASTSVIPVAAPVISTIVQSESTITLTATGSSLSVPTPPSGLTTSSTSSPFIFTGATGNTTYNFTVQASGTSASNTAASSITTLATPAAPTISSIGTTITLAWPSAGTYNIYSNTLVTPATSNTTNATITSGITIGTARAYTIALTSGGNTSIQSSSVSITPLAAPTISSIVQSGAIITVTCGIPATGVTLSIPNAPTPAGLTLLTSTSSIFEYYGIISGGTTYTFIVQSKNGSASNTASGSITILYKPGTPTVTAAGLTLTITWTYTGSYSGISFLVKDLNNNWTGTTVPGALFTTFTGIAGTRYSIAIAATSGGSQSEISARTDISIFQPPTFTQNYQLTTQAKIVGTAAASGATSYSGTTDSTSVLSAATAVGGTLTWTGATGGKTYTGVTIGAAGGGGATSSLANRELYSAFTPTSITGCQVWYDGSDPAGTGTPPVDGTIVTTWVNRGAGGSAFNATKYSTYSAGTYSAANRALSFNTSPITLYSTGYTGTPSSETIFIVFNVTNPTGTNNTLIGGLVTGGRGFGCGATGSGNGTIGYLNMANAWQSMTGGYLSGTTMMATGQLATGKTAVSLNGASLTTPTAFPAYSGGGTTYLGAQVTGANTFSYNGFAMEIIIYNTVLTTNQIQTVQGYLAWKWGIQGILNSANPYSPAAIPPAVAPPLTVPTPTGTVTYLVVGGGGGGGSRFGGGGGAGGFQTGSLAVSGSTNYTVTVGAGGAGGSWTGGPGAGGASFGANGSPSVFSTITSLGGGGGAAGDTGNGLSGGSGGGGAGRAINAAPYLFFTSGGAGTSGQGNNGKGSTTNSYIGGGGGGAGAAATLNAGGAGTASSITGTSITYAGGGGGGGTGDGGGPGGSQDGAFGGVGGGGRGGLVTPIVAGGNVDAIAGTPNTGGGGGGGSYTTWIAFSHPNNNVDGANGGSGIVIISCPSTLGTPTIGGSLTYTSNIVSTNVVYIFTAGTGTISW